MPDNTEQLTLGVEQLTLGVEQQMPRSTKGIKAVLNENTVFQTEGIRYSGSKRTLIPFIAEAIKGLPIRTALDGFTGTTRVAQYFKKAGFSVHANDLALYSSVFARCYLLNNDTSPRGIKDKLDHLNSLQPVEGFYTENYGGDDDGAGNVVAKDGKKKPFQRKNAMKLDAIRPEIDRIAENETEKAILLTSLILGLDKIENTLGHQVAYLAQWASRSYDDLVLELPSLIKGTKEYSCTQQDVATLQGEWDLAYFDPPYNTNNTVTVTTRVRYASYYHFWTTLIKNDRPQLVGAANRREDLSSDSIPGVITPYESTKAEHVEKEFEKLFRVTSAPLILLSYSNKGKITPERVVEIMSTFGRVEVTRIDHKENVQRTLTINQQWLGDQSQNFEYLFLLRKG